MEQLPQTVRDVLEQLDDPGQVQDESEIYDQLRKAQAVVQSTEPNDALQAELIAFAFAVYDIDDDSSSSGHFQSLMSGTDSEGKAHHFPDRDHVPPDFISYWQSRSQETQHPVLRARYADLVWDLGRATTGKPPEVTAALTAIDGYLDAIERHLTQPGYGLEQKIGRALALALQIKNPERIARAKATILALDQEAGDGTAPGAAGLAYDLLLPDTSRVGLRTDEEQAVIERQEKLLAASAAMASTATKEQPAGNADPFLVERVAQRLAHYYRKRGRTDDYRRVLMIYVAVFADMAKSASGLVASTWLERVHAVLRSFGLTQEADEVAVLLRSTAQRSASEMKTISHTMEIKREDLEKLAAALLTGPLDERCARLAAHFLPRREKVEGQVKELARSFPLQFLIPKAIVDRDGRTVARVGSIEADLEGQVVHRIAQNLGLESIFFHFVLQKLQEGTDVPALLQVLRQSPLFEERVESVLRTGIAAHYSGDFVTSLHLLTPQIERALRRLLELSGISTYRPGRHGGFKLKTLDEILREPAIEQVLGTDFTLYARVLLTDHRGLNVRNALAHGVLTADQMTSALGDRIIHVLLMIARVRAKDTADA